MSGNLVTPDLEILNKCLYDIKMDEESSTIELLFLKLNSDLLIEISDLLNVKLSKFKVTGSLS